MYLGVVIVAFAATYGLLRVCEWLSHNNYDHHLNESIYDPLRGRRPVGCLRSDGTGEHS